MNRFILLAFLAMIPAAAMADSGDTNRGTEPMIEIQNGTNAPIEVRLNDGGFQTRYRLQTDNSGKTTNEAIEYQLLLDVTISFFNDRVRIDFAGQNGSSFTGGWAHTGIGMGDPNMAFFIRRLALTLNPKKGLDFTIGSMKPEYGVGSENTSLDNDGYIMGYRSKVALEKGYLTITTGYVGDFKDPNVFNRFGRLDEVNFLQAAITHSIGEIVRGTLEYTQLAGENFARGAIKLDLSKWVTFIDSITLEDIHHVSPDNAGNVISAKLAKRFKDLIAGRDLSASLAYIYKTKDGFDGFPLGDKVWDGHSLRVNVGIPDFVSVGGMLLGMFIDYVQSISDFDRFRFEFGLALKF